MTVWLIRVNEDKRPQIKGKITYFLLFSKFYPGSTQVLLINKTNNLQLFSMFIFSDTSATTSPLNLLNYPGSVEEKEKKLNEMIMQLQFIRDYLVNQSEKVIIQIYLSFLIFHFKIFNLKHMFTFLPSSTLTKISIISTMISTIT